MKGFRADRAATLWLFHPLRRLTRTAAARIPILMYHSISDLDESGRGPYYKIGTSPRAFEAQLCFLRTNGYQSIGLQQAVAMMDGTAQGPEKPVVLTFDDGYQDFYTEAFPLLSRFGYSATVFLPTAYIGDVALTFNGIECLTWDQVRQLHQAGIEFGSHTVTHPQLYGMSSDQLRKEVGVSKHQIEQKLGESVEAFSYPYAFPETDRQFIGRLRSALEESSYQSGVSTIIGLPKRSDNRLFMKRVPVNSHDDTLFFRAKLEGAYDWLHVAQRLSKQIRALV